MKLVTIILILATIGNCTLHEYTMLKIKNVDFDKIDSTYSLSKFSSRTTIEDFEVIEEKYESDTSFLYQKVNFLLFGFEYYYLDYIFAVNGVKYRKIYACPDFIDAYVYRYSVNEYSLKKIFNDYDHEINELNNITVIKRAAITLNPLTWFFSPIDCLILTGTLGDSSSKKNLNF